MAIGRHEGRYKGGIGKYTSEGKHVKGMGEGTREGMTTPHIPRTFTANSGTAGNTAGRASQTFVQAEERALSGQINLAFGGVAS